MIVTLVYACISENLTLKLWLFLSILEWLLINIENRNKRAEPEKIITDAGQIESEVKIEKVNRNRNCSSFSHICLYSVKIYYSTNAVYNYAFKLSMKRKSNIWKDFKGPSVNTKSPDNI